MKEIHLNNPNADIYVPGGIALEKALARTTHLGIGAHQDDLEFMAMHGIIECYEHTEKWFSGITCTNGGGSARTGPYAGTSDEEMKLIRAEEQREAARVGQYACMAQLGYSSSEIKGVSKDPFVKDLVSLISAASPDVIYTHNPADKHPTHIAVLVAAIAALRSMPADARPRKVIGCEGWRDLDWLPDNRKVIMDVSAYPELSARINGIFRSQISGGKRYDLAVAGRRHANATMLDSHSVDAATSVSFGMDLTPLIEDDTLPVPEYVAALIQEFLSDVQEKIRKSGS